VPRDGETLGEIMLRGNTIMKGYCATSAPAPRRFAKGGTTRGPGGVHPDGYIEVKDRSKDVIISAARTSLRWRWRSASTAIRR